MATEHTRDAPSLDAGAIPRIAHREAMVLAATEYRRALALFLALEPADYARPTDCEKWDVRCVVLHLLGTAEANASLPEQIRQMRRGSILKTAVDSPYWWDGANEFQIRKHDRLRNDEIAAAFKAVAPKALAARRDLPAPIRALPLLKLPEPFGRKPLDYLTDAGFTRDLWMHRVDIARATGRPLVLSADHDGRLIADIVAEWATLYGEPFDLELTGEAGGRFHFGTAGVHVRLDAVEFCRILSGRAEGAGVLANPLPL